MLLLYMAILWPLQTALQHQFNMRNNHQGQDEYCLLYYVHDHIYDKIKGYIEDEDTIVVEAGSYVAAHQLIPYCLQLTDKNLFNEKFNNSFDSHYTFATLREKDISSEQLLSWSAPIDLVELYQMFLDSILPMMPPFELETIFYNCTSPWFGPFCRFTFNISSEKSFEEIVDLNFQLKSKLQKYGDRTCYTHLACNPLVRCLDWRDICDRKMDCFDGSDELNCWQLELNECAENEYRCYNGQCIPLVFFHDAPMNPDCIDTTDERTHLSYPKDCHMDPAFRCEEHTCRPRDYELSCGDGCCSQEFKFRCQNGRDNLFYEDLCSRSLACFMTIEFGNKMNYKWCKNFSIEIDFLRKNCPSLLEFSGGPILFGHVRFIYNITERTFSSRQVLVPDHICYNEKLCEDYLPATIYLNDMTCRHFHELRVVNAQNSGSFDRLTAAIKNRFRKCLVLLNDTHYCNHSTMYRCLNSSKCISKHRLVDGIYDCPFDDDETYNESCSLNDAHQRFVCIADNVKKYYAPLTIQDGIDDCQNSKDEPSRYDKLDKNRIYFQSICNGRTELTPVNIDEEQNTDETDCEIWPCNNTYTRCDGIWHCDNGADEINCSPSHCSNKEHSCIFPNNASKISCLPMVYAGNGIVDCLGATDERNDNRKITPYSITYYFQCRNFPTVVPSRKLCDNHSDCQNNNDDDEIFCQSNSLRTSILCADSRIPFLTEVEEYFCNFSATVILPAITFFKLYNMFKYPSSIKINYMKSVQPIQMITSMIQNNPTADIEQIKDWQCHRGIPIYIRMSNNISELFCLCPPSYYGNQCQYQNQRVSLTLQIEATSDWHSVFIFLITLIDDENNIESNDYIEYLPIRDCQIKFNIYLLYSTRPKISSKHYSVRIDAFNKMTLNYRASWLFPIHFSYLPVYRLVVLLTVPFSNSKPNQICKSPCIHGQCYNYINDPKTTFCRCFPGWSGIHCDIRYICDCASDSLCVGKSICLCPLDRFGPRCYLRQSLCHSETCDNGGQCILGDERYASFHLNKPMCICLEGYFGDRCEYEQHTRIDVRFHKTFSIPSVLLIHLITIPNTGEPTRTTMMKKIAFNQNSVLFSTSIPFNIVFAEMYNKLYLIILQEQTIVSATISTEIIPSHRCRSINEVFNHSVINLHLLKRIKLYHIPCHDRSELICFYDSIHICLCNLVGQANCFEFNHNMTHDCRGYNLCENGGECFQDNFKCPTLSTCVCRDCYYGSRCQFSTKGSTLSLDAILGYAIRPNTRISQQSNVVQVAIIATTLIFGLGIISNLLAFITFNSKKARSVGCGIYLLVSSMISILALSLLLIKFWILVTSQIGSIENRSFLHIQCIMIDYFLRVLVSSGDWLSACVAYERAINVTRGPKFDKIKSRKSAKRIIWIVLALVVGTYLHDPIHRQLIDDNEEQRTWCVTEYSSSLQRFGQILNVIHFSIPISINCISALIIIVTATRTRSNAQKKLIYRKILLEQLSHHKQLLISSFILILVALPRVIISFLSGCMKSARNPWFYLIGYYISFIPPMLTFVIFVLPSKTYKREFKKSLERFF